MSSNKKVLLLGAGFVTKPTLVELVKKGVSVTVACRTLEHARSLCAGLENTTAIALDVTNADDLDAEVAKVDLVISLIPYTHHVAVIRAAIRAKKNVVTTSYVSPAMQALDADARAAGITVLNEVGLDPGIDHLYAVKTIDEVHRAGGRIRAFRSYCGGLPDPDVARDNPLGYKFSWSPRGVLLAMGNTARFIRAGAVVEIPGAQLMANARPYPSSTGYDFVGYPNRDSTPYRERYNIPEAQTVERGTLRYRGFPEIVRVLVDLGFLSEEKKPFLDAAAPPLSWREVSQKLLDAPSSEVNDLEAAIPSRTTFKDEKEKKLVMDGLRWLGLFSDEKVTPRDNALDTLCATLEAKMQYGPNEQDMVFLQHTFEIEHSDGREETRISTLLDFGEPDGTSAMAKLVGIPCAVAALFVLDGTIAQRGILAPLTPEINNPLIEELKKYDIQCYEQTI